MNKFFFFGQVKPPHIPLLPLFIFSSSLFFFFDSRQQCYNDCRLTSFLLSFFLLKEEEEKTREKATHVPLAMKHVMLLCISRQS